MREPPVIMAGVGVISAAGANQAALLAALQANASHLQADERFAAPRFQSNVVGAAPIDPAGDDPAWQLATRALREAVTDAHQRSIAAGARTGLAQVSPARLGLVLSTTKANIAALESQVEGRSSSPAARRHLQADLLAADLATEFQARGPVQNISNACVSGLVALMQGTKLIQRGAADAVLVVGVDHLSAFVVGGFSALKAIDPTGCRPFDQQRRGLSPGEAGAAVVLRRGADDDASAVTVRGWGASNDANHMTGPSRDGAGLAQAIRCALARAHLTPAEIDYINVHGTGTPYNDAMESAALRTVFGEHIPPLSGMKGMLGHTLGAAGVVESIGCVLALEQQFLPGTPRLETVADDLPPQVLKGPRPAAVRRVLKLNTGFGGVNGALILERSTAP